VETTRYAGVEVGRWVRRRVGRWVDASTFGMPGVMGREHLWTLIHHPLIRVASPQLHAVVEVLILVLALILALILVWVWVVGRPLVRLGWRCLWL
jgi:hypothetical protein